MYIAWITAPFSPQNWQGAPWPNVRVQSSNSPDDPPPGGKKQTHRSQKDRRGRLSRRGETGKTCFCYGEHSLDRQSCVLAGIFTARATSVVVIRTLESSFLFNFFLSLGFCLITLLRRSQSRETGSATYRKRCTFCSIKKEY